MTVRQARGQRAEQLAATYLQQHGYEILATNWRCRGGEIDLVARHGATLVFVEVRARTAGDTSVAFESVGRRKQARMLTAAQSYVADNAPDDADWRIDMIAVAFRAGAPLIDHVENALDW